ncbi:hypothetical protein [Dinghuibacter silviterrae]|uniref:Arc-like DNA binding domain-containing protein n=1 Tax=Dinghuibacter silviterrae TaxID=1539049 RepID=A0A4R8DSV4_9BACT|nr:hypothetical protein [Dinghuibacter silviterrae]TDX00958.1 hypothetical protein EDB95_1989 [Dinghuibacter silviterrae]
MSAKKSFALRLDAHLYEALEKWAQDEFRSVNGQIEWVLNQQLKAAGRLREKRGPETNERGKGPGSAK